MKHKKNKKWLFEKYKQQHPELFPAKKIKFEIPQSTMRVFVGMAIFLLLNILSILVAAAINADIRALIF